MIELKTSKTMNYTATISVDGNVVKTMSQGFDEQGMRTGSIGEYISNKELYFSNLLECRKQEDEFLKQMRIVEDQAILLEVKENVENQK
ncbi:MAG: hypothetical protein RR585_01440 [Coprobacillus sp.]